MIILDKHFVYAQSYPILNNVDFAPISSLQVVGFKNSQDIMESIIWEEDFENPQPYVIFKNAVFVPYLLSK